MQIHLADHVLPISGPPLQKGAVAVSGETITAVGAADELLPRFPEARPIDHGNTALLPGFVNCHSHLELTSLRGRLDDVEHDFRSWLLKITSIRSEMTDIEIRASALAGAREGAAAGITCFGDIGRSGFAGVEALKQVGLRGIVFQETEFSPDDRTAADDFGRLAEIFESMYGNSTDLVKVGLSPHSAYTVSSRLFELISQYSIVNRIPISIHAAESPSEYELLMEGKGFFTEVYEKFDVEWAAPRCTAVQYLERLGVLAARPLLAHCVTVDQDDIKRLADYDARVAHCPRSNAKFGHGWAPLEQLCDAQIKVGLGSDSVASNNICDILGESAFAALGARNRPGSVRMFSAADALRTATLGGAAALGLEDSIGSLEPGKMADMVVIGLDALCQEPVNDIESALVFSSSGRDVIATYVAGTQVYP